MKFLLNLIPAPYRLAAGLAALFFVVAGSASLGGWGAWKIATWRANDAWQEKVTTLETSVTNLKQDLQDRDTSIKDLKASIDTQNRAIAALELATAETSRLQEEARKAAEIQAKAAAKRVADLQRMLAPTRANLRQIGASQLALAHPKALSRQDGGLGGDVMRKHLGGGHHGAYDRLAGVADVTAAWRQQRERSK